MSSDDLKKIPPEAMVFRMWGEVDFVPPGVEKPRPAAFELSSDDKKDRKNGITGALLSVWDLGRTSVPQAASIRPDKKIPEKAFVLQVRDIQEKVFFHDGSNPLRVLRDPLPETTGPGANGHCGISGLDRKPSEQKIWYKELRRQLVDLCKLLKD